MEAHKKRNIKSGLAYDHLFPKASVGTDTIMKHAGVGDTCAFIPKVVNKTLDQTKAIAEKLKGATTYQTCSNIWHFVYGHIAYRKDEDGYEQIRSPARAWHDRRGGVDCDCYSTFISSILTNLGIPHTLRITKYHRDHFQHIYPIVPVANGKHITLDCVTDKFDYEVPFSEKKDYKMDLQYLNGIEGMGTGMGGLGSPDYDLNGDGVMELGKIAKKKQAGGTTKKQARQAKKAKRKASRNDPSKKKKGFRKLLNIVNKVNPATIALRNGVLAAMKLNIGKIGSRLRWSYLPPADAAKKNIDPAKFKKLLATRQKLEDLFYGAGGKPENMKKAILKGKGNNDKAVHGLGILDLEGFGDIDYMDINSPLSAVLGADIYHSENIDGMDDFEGFGELGEPVTMATVAAASGVIATIAGMLKKIGDIFKGGKGAGSEDFSEEANAQAEKEVAETKGADGSGGSSTEIVKTGGSPDDNSGGGGESGGGSNLPVHSPSGGGTPSSPSGGTSEDGSEPGGGGGTKGVKTKDDSSPDEGGGAGGNESFWAKHKKWLLPVSIGVGSIAVIGIAMTMMKKHPATPSPHRPSGKAVNGLGKVSKGKNHHRKTANKKHGNKKAVALV